MLIAKVKNPRGSSFERVLIKMSQSVVKHLRLYILSTIFESASGLTIHPERMGPRFTLYLKLLCLCSGPGKVKGLTKKTDIEFQKKSLRRRRADEARAETYYFSIYSISNGLKNR